MLLYEVNGEISQHLFEMRKPLCKLKGENKNKLIKIIKEEDVYNFLVCLLK